MKFPPAASTAAYRADRKIGKDRWAKGSAEDGVRQLPCEWFVCRATKQQNSCSIEQKQYLMAVLPDHERVRFLDEVIISCYIKPSQNYQPGNNRCGCRSVSFSAIAVLLLTCDTESATLRTSQQHAASQEKEREDEQSIR